MNYPKTFQELIECFEQFPGVGPKTAERYAFYAIKENKITEIENLIKTLSDSLNLIHECSICGMITDQDICDICSDESRSNQLMLVEDCKSIIAYEKTKAFKGRYHILKSLISPTNGIGPEDIGLEKVIDRIRKNNITEVIIAFPANLEGELTSLYIKKVLSKENVKVYQIGYGLPVEASIEYADEITLIKSLESKKEI
jgi:recombination protein RecR